ncbi:Fe(3+) ABC transporter substrate-binding protein [Pseudogemmobacter sp. W21_MBD1_M6]|uniref:Fe(3+) ABC transporter substrate-binding protein n=1 Tax=Pseudogemmobacter sp. W21_MBD1_M6 TaxID=3240271 RepID=UPI003F9D6C01
MTTIRSALFATTLLAIAAPVLAEEVNIYSYRQPELIQPLLDAFTADTGITTNVAFVEKGLTERLVAEGARSPADIILTVDVSRVAEAVDAGVTQKVDSAVLTENIPSVFRDPDGQWFALTTRARIVYASKDRVKDGEITTYEDLADPKWKGRICTRSGTHSYTLGLVAAMLAHHDAAYTTTWLEGVKANLAMKPQGNDRAQVKSIWAGECDISLGNTYYMGEMLADPEQTQWANAVRIMFPVFEGGGTHVNMSGVAMTKAAPNRDAALTLMEYLSSPKAQQIYAETNYEYPVKEGTPASDLVASWGSLTPDTLDLIQLAKLRGDALKLVETVDFDG